MVSDIIQSDINKTNMMSNVMLSVVMLSQTMTNVVNVNSFMTQTPEVNLIKLFFLMLFCKLNHFIKKAIYVKLL
jgi:hypothetical protein